MEDKKYELIRSNESSFASFRIRALRDIPKYGVRKGDLGGLVLNKRNLSQSGDGWIDETSEVIESALVVNGYISNGSVVAGDAHIESGIIKDSKILGDSWLEGDIQIEGSILRNCRLLGSGMIEKSKLVNCLFDCPFEISSSTLESQSPHSPLFVADSLHLKDVELNVEKGDVMAKVTMERVQLYAKEFLVEHMLFMTDAQAHYSEKFIVDMRSGKEELRTDIVGRKGQLIQLSGERLIIKDSIVKGSMLLSGNLEIRLSILIGMHHIEMNKGYIENTSIIDCVTIKQTSPKTQFIRGEKFEGDMSIDYDQQ